MAKKPAKKSINKNDKSRVEIENQQRKLILISVISVAVLVVGILGYGILDQIVFKGMRPVASVDGEKISVNDFDSQVRYSRMRLYQQYFQSVQLYQAYLQIDENLASQFASSNLMPLGNHLSAENANMVGEDTLDWMIDEVIIRAEAKERGITIADEDIEELLHESFRFYPDGTPTMEPTATMFVTSTMSAEQYALVTATPLPTATIVPTETEEPQEEAEETAEEIAETEEAQPEPTQIIEPTPTEYTLEGYQSEYASYIDLMKESGIAEKELRETIRTELIRQELMDQLTEGLTAEEDQVWARHILVADEATAQEVLAKLDEGQDWTDLAAEYSTDEGNKNSGGDLGWFNQTTMVDPFTEAAFSLETGGTSAPVETSFGFHIIQAIGHEVRPISQTEFDTLKSQVFTDWLEETKLETEIEKFDRWVESTPLEPAIPMEYSLEYLFRD